MNSRKYNTEMDGTVIPIDAFEATIHHMLSLTVKTAAIIRNIDGEIAER